MLSLDKTKSIDDLKNFIRDKNCLLMHKLDGLSVLLTYNDGVLVRAETRGNGIEGEDITHNARVFENIPLTIPSKGKVEIEGEAIITYGDFEKINFQLPEGEKYKTPRNLVSGSVRQLDSSMAAKRHIKFIAWKVPTGMFDSIEGRLQTISSYGFDIVDFAIYDSLSGTSNIESNIQHLKDVAKEYGYPIDGLVVTYDSISYGESLGSTGHHPKHSLAFKFADEEVETTLTGIEWSMGKFGTLTPVALFKPVEIDGTEVARASLHNISIMKTLELGIGDTITVYKANMIIPKIKDNLTRSNDVNLPIVCPICDGRTSISTEVGSDTEVLFCLNPDCNGKLLGRLNHFVSKNAINIDGLSEATLEKFIGNGWLSAPIDIYNLKYHKDEMYIMEGFGKRSVDKLLENIEKSRDTTLNRFIYSLSIPLIGRTASKSIHKEFNGSFERLLDALCNRFAFDKLNDFGRAMDDSLTNYFTHNHYLMKQLAEEFVFQVSDTADKSNAILDGKTFVITGSVNQFKNREELKDRIESLGGKVYGSVSAKTDYLINNDVHSTSGKNARAKQLGIPIISEEEIIRMMG